MIITAATPLGKTEVIELEELIGMEHVTEWSDRGAILDLNPNQVRWLINQLRGSTINEED